ncbi:hypothetical protein QRQ56_25550 [Bradyrhizobium sp. U531]|uniref:hypothetical protein n=1 Tax=Bradyrhizobium sp. U531 TaxID=3053458 RepID=UPI003F43014C
MRFTLIVSAIEVGEIAPTMETFVSACSLSHSIEAGRDQARHKQAHRPRFETPDERGFMVSACRVLVKRTGAFSAALRAPACRPIFKHHVAQTSCSSDKSFGGADLEVAATKR